MNGEMVETSREDVSEDGELEKDVDCCEAVEKG